MDINQKKTLLIQSAKEIMQDTTEYLGGDQSYAFVDPKKPVQWEWERENLMRRIGKWLEEEG